MSSAAVPELHRGVRFYQAPIGKKAVMAVTGVILFGYVVGHLLGNLQIYSADRDQINRYAAFLHDPSLAVALWGVRLLLLAAVVLHITASIQLWIWNRAARPVRYQTKDDVPASYAARTMLWSGPILAAFIIFHILHLTVGSVLPLQELGPNHPNVRANLIAGFQHPAIAIFYIVAMVLLCLHLYHGLWSMLQSLGLSQQRSAPTLQRLAAIVAVLIAAGNISIPVAVMAGLLVN